MLSALGPTLHSTGMRIFVVASEALVAHIVLSFTLLQCLGANDAFKHKFLVLLEFYDETNAYNNEK